MDNETEPRFKAKAQPFIPEIALCRVEIRDRDLAIHAPAETIADSIWAAHDLLKRAVGVDMASTITSTSMRRIVGFTGRLLISVTKASEYYKISTDLQGILRS